MGNIITFDSTVTNCWCDGKNNIVIKCNPSYDGQNLLILKRSHPHFTYLYEKLKINETYTFKVKHHQFEGHIIDIEDLQIYTFTGMINDILNLEVEKIDHYVELLTNKKKIRFLMHKDLSENVVVYNTYKITYKKFWCGNRYEVLTLERV